MPTKVRIVSPKGRSMVISGRTDFATIKEKGRELLVASDVCPDDENDERRPRSSSDEDEAMMQRARARRASYDVQFSLRSSREPRGDGDGDGDGEAEGGERVVKVAVEWLPPRRGDGARDGG